MYEDGTFIIKGRLADAIRFKVFSEVVHPGPIEDVISKHPAIANISVSVKVISWVRHMQNRNQQNFKN